MCFNHNSTSYTYKPVAFIAKDKNRLKQNGQQVYLNNKDNFEIELYNPSQNTVLAKIKINGQYIPGGGLVLRPGMRHFLDRYLDVARKFVFSTYEVDGNDAEAVAAIARNGEVVVEFYNEKTTAYTDYIKINDLLNRGQEQIKTPWPRRDEVWYSHTNDVHGGFAASDFTTTITTSSLNMSTNSNSDLLRSKSKSLSRGITSNVETGRIEKGAASDQKFGTVDMEFETSATNTLTWYIKPKSTEPVEVKDLATYCTECGKKIKSNWKFCATCGNKVSA